MVTAPSSNRVILVHDPVNALLELSPALPAALAQADLVLLSGLNAVADPGHARGLAERVVALVRLTCLRVAWWSTRTAASTSPVSGASWPRPWRPCSTSTA